LGVDWSSIPAFQQIIEQKAIDPKTPFIYFNYKVYHRCTGFSSEDLEFYFQKEKEACNLANRILCLSSNDSSILTQIVPKKCKVILPPLREDILTRVKELEGDRCERIYFLSCVRVSKDKNVHLFVEVVENLGNHFFQENGIIPCFVGTAMDQEYCESLKDRLKKAVPGSVILDFLNPSQLCQIWKRTVLNFHPALYEAYGMTIVESAAFGVPSIVHHIIGNRPTIGALDLLTEDEVIPLDLTRFGDLVDHIKILFSNQRIQLEEIGKQASYKSLSYGETEMGTVLEGALLVD